MAHTVQLLFLSFISFSSTYSVSLEPYFRSDYKFVARQDAFYKVLQIPRRFGDAYSRCGAEGAQLAFPRTEAEANLLASLLREYLPQNRRDVWVGGHDRFAEGVYQTLDGEDIQTQYDNWCDGQPDDASFNEDCITMNRDGKLSDVPCDNVRPAICRRPRSWTFKTNPTCETVDEAYVPDLTSGRCYKVHTEPKNWSQAFGICNAEQSYLVEVNSQKEADFLTDLLKSYPADQVGGHFERGHVAVGFNDILVEGDYRTVHGKTLQETGYNIWQPGQPDNFKGIEHCGSATRSLKLNDISCHERMMFICEREIGDPNAVDLFSRVGEPKSN